MKTTTHFLLSLCAVIWATSASTRAQGGRAAVGIGQPEERVAKPSAVEADPSVSRDVRELNHDFPVERRGQLRLALRARLDAPRRYRDSVEGALSAAEGKVVAEAIQVHEKDLPELGGEGGPPGATAQGRAPGQAAAPQAPVTHAACNPTAPTDFCLGAPTHKATDRPLELTLGWTEPRQAVQKYHVQVSADPLFTSPLQIDESVDPPSDISGGEFSVKKRHGLRPGQTYYWRVRADFADGTSAWAQNGVFFFTTSNNIFEALSSKGFKLQKALTGPDKGELAEFAFLNTIGEQTVYSATFALSWQPPKRSWNFGNTNVRPSWSIEGALSSDESEAEDAWRFRLSSVFVTNFIRCRDGQDRCQPDQFTNPTFESLYYTAALKLEDDKDFDVKKLSGEFYITPNSFALAIGTARPGSPAKPIQFQWRPSFRIDAGHTFRRGDSEETEESILRLVPRARARLDLQFLRQWLNMNEVAVFADNTFYYLPLENGRKRNNFFTSGIEFNFTPNLGFGLTYKNGRSAPKFEKINTLQGVIGIRF